MAIDGQELTARSGGGGSESWSPVWQRVRHALLSSPAVPAMAGNTWEITGGDLVGHTEATAELLRGRTSPGEPVGLLFSSRLVERCAWTAVLAAGLTAVPLNVRFPKARTAAMLAESDAHLLLTDTNEGETVTSLPGSAVLAVTGGEQAELSDDRGVMEPGGGYLLFTSGTTGRPKGVRVGPSQLLAFLDVACTVAGSEPGARFSSLFECTFDLSVFDALVPWLVGGTSYLPEPADMLDPIAYAARHGLTTWFSVPSVIAHARRAGRLTPGCLPDLRRSLFCGERLLAADAREWVAAAARSSVVNLYGPTEATVFVAGHDFDDREGSNGTVPIGEPYAGVTVSVVDDQGVPGVDEGELCLAGAQVVPGYLRSADDEGRFADLGGVRHYLTGDRVRREAAGLVHLGRLDEQVKIHGYRVELGEIESALRQVPGVRQAAVVAVPQGDELEIVGVVAGDAEPDQTMLRALAATLPSYMLPGRLVKVDALPLNSNAKIDRAALRHTYMEAS